jgi:pilus assembly protein CpaB
VGINQILATPSGEVQTVGIVVAKKEIKKGDVIKPDDIRLQEWHVDALPEGAIQKIDDLAERRVKTLVVPGEAILDSKLVPKGLRENEIPSGMKAVTVQVDAVSGTPGLLSPGDNVDVLVHTTANNMSKMAQTKVLFRNVKVHAIDSTLERPDAGETTSVAKTVTLLATPKQALAITHAAKIGEIQLLARSTKDDDEESGSIDDSVNDSTLFGTGDGSPEPTGDVPLPTVAQGPPSNIGESFSKGILDILKEARDLGAPEPVEQPWKMVLIEGIERKELEFTKDSRLPQPAGGGKSPLDAPFAEPDDEPTADDVISKLPPIDQEET